MTDVAGQTVTFAPGDPLGLNQFDAALHAGTINSMTQARATRRAGIAGGTQAGNGAASG